MGRTGWCKWKEIFYILENASHQQKMFKKRHTSGADPIMLERHFRFIKKCLLIAVVVVNFLNQLFDNVRKPVINESKWKASTICLCLVLIYLSVSEIKGPSSHSRRDGDSSESSPFLLFFVFHGTKWNERKTIGTMSTQENVAQSPSILCVSRKWEYIYMYIVAIIMFHRLSSQKETNKWNSAESKLRRA
jgi:hypothetical protein